MRRQRFLKVGFHPLAAVSGEARRAAELFYADLFQRLPDTRDLFVTDMTRQGDKLIATLGAVVLRIENWSSVESQVTELGLRHAAYGVHPDHYAPTGEALFQTFAVIQGDAFTEEHRAVWVKAYFAIAGAMTTAVEKRKSTPSQDPAEG